MAADAEGLFVAHHRQLFRYLCQAVGQPEVARDLTQDVFVRVSRTQVPDAPAQQVRAWLFRIARNLALDHHRQRVSRAEVVAEVDTRGPANQHVALVVNQALASLADLDRDVFLMREVAGLSYGEIAEACDVSADAVRSRLHRTRLQLREWLAEPIDTRRGAPLRQQPVRSRSL
jgi:RNA polymerase sigma-70 factor (ECF subfamily)